MQSSSARTVAVVMAAGLGTRMKSAQPKVLFAMAGRPLVYFPVKAALAAGADRAILVTSPTGKQQVAEALHGSFDGDRTECVVQDPPRGTGDAVAVAMQAPSAQGASRFLIVSGDTPLVSAEDLLPLSSALESAPSAKVSFLTFLAADPTGYGRVLRDAAGGVSEIREHRDLQGPSQTEVRECNAGFYLVDGDFLRSTLPALKAENSQGEYYLTDIVRLAAQAGGAIAVSRPEQSLMGINDRVQLAQAERLLFQRIADGHRRAGVSIAGEAWIDEGVVIEQDASIAAGVSLRGAVRIGPRTTVDVGCVIQSSSLGADTKVLPYCVISDSKVGDRAQIGPFAHLRPDSHIGDEAKIGNFVETKKTHMRRGAKANHLTYLGDADVGEGSNIGAGTICCNYDGFNKAKTTIGKNVFIGSDSQLVAPVSVGDGAYVATATTVTEDVPPDALAIGRTRQSNKPGYAQVLRDRLKAKKDGASSGH